MLVLWKGPHPKQACPARNVACHTCSKKGHYSSVCRSKSLATVSEEQQGNSSFLDTYIKGTSWTAPIKINNQEIVFKLDTGAEATAITTKTFKTLKNIKLKCTKISKSIMWTK